MAAFAGLLKLLFSRTFLQLLTNETPLTSAFGGQRSIQLSYASPLVKQNAFMINGLRLGNPAVLLNTPNMRAEPPYFTRDPYGRLASAVVTEDEAGLRLDRWFKRRFPALALSHLAKICRKGEVRVDGKRVETSTRLEEGQTDPRAAAQVDAPAAPGGEARESARMPAIIARMTLFEDKDVLVLNKPFGLAVQGGSGTKRHIDGMLESLAKGNSRPVLVHRLDRDTSRRAACRQKPRTSPQIWANCFARARRRKSTGRWSRASPKPTQGRISLYLAKGAGMGDERWSAQAGPPSARPGENARRPPWRGRRPALADLLRHCR